MTCLALSEWEARARAWPVLLCPHGDERSLLRKAKPPGSQAALPGCTDSPLICSLHLAALLHPWPRPRLPLPFPVRSGWCWGTSRALPCSAHPTPIAVRAGGPFPATWKSTPLEACTLPQVQKASLSHLPVHDGTIMLSWEPGWGQSPDENTSKFMFSFLPLVLSGSPHSSSPKSTPKINIINK